MLFVFSKSFFSQYFFVPCNYDSLPALCMNVRYVVLVNKITKRSTGRVSVKWLHKLNIYQLSGLCFQSTALVSKNHKCMKIFLKSITYVSRLVSFGH